MYRFVLLFTLLLSLALQAQHNLTGLILDASTGKPLAGANIEVLSEKMGTVSDDRGHFLLENLSTERTYTIRISYLGFRSAEYRIDLSEKRNPNRRFELHPVTLEGREMLIVTTRAVEGESPVAFSTLTREDLEQRYYAQDIPVLLSDLPSLTSYSEGGSGLGYNYLSIRGFDQRRVSVMINGVPQNDPEDHNVYWVDFPDLLGDVEDIQVQRGAGSAFYGPPAIGGSINIITRNFHPERSATLYGGLGSYKSNRTSLSYNTGLLAERYVLAGRISRIRTNGYRESAALDFKGFFLGAAHFGERSTTRLHLFGGPIEDELAYYGLPKEIAQNRDTRRTNYISDPREIENFSQPHLELLNTYQITPNLTLNNTLFGIRGSGFFDYQGNWAPASYYRLTPDFGFDVGGDPGEAYFSDVLIRAYVDNRQGGWLPNLTWKAPWGRLTAGSEIRVHRSLHWGRIQDGSEDLPMALPGSGYSGRNYIAERRYYEYKGGKEVVSPFFQIIYKRTRDLTLSTSLQYVYQKNRLFDEAFLGNEFDLTYNFLNPRFGATYRFREGISVFASVAQTSREPRLKNFYDAAEASTPADWGAIVPQFRQNGDGSYDFSDPLVKPEKLVDYELGFQASNDILEGNLNLYFMDFQDEIIKSGQLDRFGQPITGNAAKTRHSGLEISGSVRPLPAWRLFGNATVSRNELVSYRTFDDNNQPASLDGNTIAGFPGFLANAGVSYNGSRLNGALIIKHVGKQYTDNFEDETLTVEPYTVVNATLGINLKAFLPLDLQLQLHVMNVLDNLYIAYGEGQDFFPAAERHFFFNFRLNL